MLISKRTGPFNECCPPPAAIRNRLNKTHKYLIEQGEKLRLRDSSMIGSIAHLEECLEHSGMIRANVKGERQKNLRLDGRQQSMST